MKWLFSHGFEMIDSNYVCENQGEILQKYTAINKQNPISTKPPCHPDILQKYPAIKNTKLHIY